MNRSELASAVADKTDLSASQVNDVLSAAFDSIASAVGQGDSVTLAGFGTFERRERSARTGRNPQTGESIDIAASKVPGFKAAAAFKRTVNGD